MKWCELVPKKNLNKVSIGRVWKKNQVQVFVSLLIRMQTKQPRAIKNLICALLISHYIPKKLTLPNRFFHWKLQ